MLIISCAHECFRGGTDTDVNGNILHLIANSKIVMRLPNRISMRISFKEDLSYVSLYKLRLILGDIKEWYGIG